MQYGSHDTDIFVDTVGRDAFDGLGGYDIMVYFMRSDPIRVTLSGANDSTVYVGNIAEDTLRNIEDIIAGSGNDVLVGDDRDNIFIGASGDDRLYGGGDSDQLKGDDGKDFLDGGEGADWALYKDKFVSINVTLPESGTGIVYVDGVAEDTLNNIENIQGGAGNDSLIGNSDDNTFEGREGRDFLQGNGGADHFIYSHASHGGDVIRDFNSNEQDKLDLDLLADREDDQDLSFTGTQSGPFSVWYQVIRDKGSIVSADTDGNDGTTEFSIMLAGVTDLRANDFILT